MCVWRGVSVCAVGGYWGLWCCSLSWMMSWLSGGWSLRWWVGGSEGVGVGGRMMNEWTVCGWVTEVVCGWVGGWVGGEWGGDRVCCRMGGRKNDWVSGVKKEWMEEWLGEEVTESVAKLIKQWRSDWLGQGRNGGVDGWVKGWVKLLWIGWLCGWAFGCGSYFLRGVGDWLGEEWSNMVGGRGKWVMEWVRDWLDGWLVGWVMLRLIIGFK